MGKGPKVCTRVVAHRRGTKQMDDLSHESNNTGEKCEISTLLASTMHSSLGQLPFSRSLGQRLLTISQISKLVLYSDLLVKSLPRQLQEVTEVFLVAQPEHLKAAQEQETGSSHLRKTQPRGGSFSILAPLSTDSPPLSRIHLYALLSAFVSKLGSALHVTSAKRFLHRMVKSGPVVSKVCAYQFYRGLFKD